jgi:hypothetical protein
MNRFSLRLLIALGLLVLLTSAALAQSRTLQPNQPVEGSINAGSPAQIYNFTGSAGAEISISVTSDVGLALTVLLTDAFGDIVAQASDSERAGTVSLDNVSLPTAGLFYVTLFPSAGQASLVSGDFTLTLSLGGSVVAPAATSQPEVQATPADETTEPVATPETTETAETPVQDTTPEQTTPVITDEVTPETFSTSQVLTTGGLQVELVWNSTADMNLELRDPVGERLYFDSRTTNNGGQFGFDVNGLCEVLTADNPTETATYAPGAIPTGSYEILIYYREECENNGPVNFTVNVTVDGVALPPISNTLTPPAPNASSVYIASFIVDQTGVAELGPQGLYTDTTVLPQPAQDYLADQHILLERDVPLAGVITNNDYYDTYQFLGNAGEAVVITMTALEGSLDTLLLVLDEAGRIVASNDDIVAGQVTDSAIDNPPLRLLTTGVYTIIATRYGKDVSGTEGVYEILVSSATAALPEEILNLNLPQGDIEVTLTWNTNADLQLLVRDPSGASVFDDSLTVASGGRMTNQGNLNCVTAEGTPVSYIYWPTQTARGGSYEIEVWYQSTCNDTRPVQFNLFIEANGQTRTFTESPQFTPQGGQRFVTSFTINPNGAVEFGDGGFIGGSETIDYFPELENALPINFGQAVPGTISPNNKFDLYVFQGTAGQNIDIAMTATGGSSLDTLVFLIGPSFLELAANDDAVIGETTDSLIDNFVLPETGEYIIIATHFGGPFGGTVGPYNLLLTLNEG